MLRLVVGHQCNLVRILTNQDAPSLQPVPPSTATPTAKRRFPRFLVPKLFLVATPSHTKLPSSYTTVSNINAQDVRGYTPLHECVAEQQIECARLLLQGTRPTRVKGAGLNIEVNARTFEGATPLHLACVLDTFLPEFVKLLVDSGADANAGTDENTTPLHLAARSGNVEAMRTLINANARIDPRDTEGMTPLHESCAVGQYKCIEVLLEHGADIHEKTHTGTGCLQLALQHEQAMELLLSHGADPYLEDSHHNSIVHLCASAGLVSSLKALERFNHLKATPQNCVRFDSRNDNGETPFHTACNTGQIAILRILEKQVSSPDEERVDFINLPDNFGMTPLFHAAAYGHVVVVEYLLKKGADPLVTEMIEHSTPLMAATLAGHESVVSTLIKFIESHPGLYLHQRRLGPDSGSTTPMSPPLPPKSNTELLWNCIMSTNPSGQNLLHACARMNHVHILEMLLEFGVKLGLIVPPASSVRAPRTLPSLNAAVAARERIAGSKLLNDILSGADDSGSTPLHDASNLGHVKVAELLLNHGGSPLAGDGSGLTPLMLASAAGHLKIVQTLLPSPLSISQEHALPPWLMARCSAMLTARDGSGRTVLEIAEDDEQVFEYILAVQSTLQQHPSFKNTAVT